MTKRPSGDQPVNVFRGSTERVAGILEQMDQDAASSAGNKRDNRRYDYRCDDCLVEVHQEGGGRPVTCQVPTRNLSAGGLSIIHRSYIHEGTALTIHLPDAAGHVHKLLGTVVRCRYVSGMAHEVGVRFQSPVDLDSFCASAPPNIAVFVGEGADPEPLTGAIRAEGAQAVAADTPKDLIKLITRTEYDAVLCREPALDRETIDKLREKGFRGPIFALGDDQKERSENDPFALVFPEQMSEQTAKDMLIRMARAA